MAEKKAKKTIKTIEIKAPRVPKFNLSMEDQAENTRIVLALQSLKVNAGWIFLMQLFQKNKELLAKMIIEKKDTDGKPITEVQADEARYKHGYLEELMGKPDEFLKKLAPHPDPKPDTVYDEGQDQKK
jgi:hypothetical protein